MTRNWAFIGRHNIGRAVVIWSVCWGVLGVIAMPRGDDSGPPGIIDALVWLAFGLMPAAVFVSVMAAVTRHSQRMSIVGAAAIGALVGCMIPIVMAIVFDRNPSALFWSLFAEDLLRFGGLGTVCGGNVWGLCRNAPREVTPPPELA